MDVVSVALGGDDPARYAALGAFVRDLCATPWGPCRPRAAGGRWALWVRLAPGHADVAARCRALGAARVDVLPAPLPAPYDYALERYAWVADDPAVRRWVAVDPHYRWGPAGAARFAAEADGRWPRSGRRFLVYRWPGLRGCARPYAGGFVGGGGGPPHPPGERIGPALAAWRAAPADAGGAGGRAETRYGDDERFLRWWLGDPPRDACVARRWPSSATRRWPTAPPRPAGEGEKNTRPPEDGRLPPEERGGRRLRRRRGARR